jgi:putative transposase
MRWRDARQKGGAEALKVRFSPGRPPKLKDTDRKRLAALLRRGPQIQGFRGGGWTTLRVARLVRRTFGVNYHRDHVGRLMHRLGWIHRKGTGWALHRRRNSFPVRSPKPRRVSSTRRRGGRSASVRGRAG